MVIYVLLEHLATGHTEHWHLGLRSLYKCIHICVISGVVSMYVFIYVTCICVYVVLVDA